ncbi:DUF2089 domain-containing protein [Candidatus Poribacteria bacterium]|nr:DUF2089 domain-containing protein [Candidatus Poribacteria bacterium]
MRKIIERCPACGNTELTITVIHCPDCDTEVRGTFVASRFCRLSEESLEFLERFVQNRGNLKEMERESGVAYTALRNRLNAVINEMGFEGEGSDEPTDPAPQTGSTDARVQRQRSEILDRLQRGEITANDAVEAIRKL